MKWSNLSWCGLASILAALLWASPFSAALVAEAIPPAPAAPAELLSHLVFDSGVKLNTVKLQAVETWTAAAETEDNSETDTVYFHHGVPIEVQDSSDGRPLAQRAREHQVLLAQKQESAIDGVGAGAALNLSGEIWTMPGFEALYRWTSPPSTAGCGARACVELDFSPLPGLHPGSRIARVLAHSAGTLFVDPATGQILRGNFHSVSPVDFGAGILARISQFSGSFEMQPVPGDSAWVLREVVMNVQGRKFLRGFHGTERMEYSVEPSPPGPGAASCAHAAPSVG